MVLKDNWILSVILSRANEGRVLTFFKAHVINFGGCFPGDLCMNGDAELLIYYYYFFNVYGPFLKSLLNLLPYCFCFTLWFFGLRHVRS